jgi:hypothetical protein
MADMPMPGGAPAGPSPDALVSEIAEKMASLADMLPEDQRAKLEALMGELASLGADPQASEPDMMSAMGGQGVPVGPQMKG